MVIDFTDINKMGGNASILVKMMTLQICANLRKSWQRYRKKMLYKEMLKEGCLRLQKKQQVRCWS